MSKPCPACQVKPAKSIRRAEQIGASVYVHEDGTTCPALILCSFMPKEHTPDRDDAHERCRIVITAEVGGARERLDGGAKTAAADVVDRVPCAAALTIAGAGDVDLPFELPRVAKKTAKSSGKRRRTA